jgi:hypothetical protein
MSNICVISGRISDYGPKLLPLPSGKWELSLTLCCDEPGRDGRAIATVTVAAQIQEGGGGLQHNPLSKEEICHVEGTANRWI